MTSVATLITPGPHQVCGTRCENASRCVQLIRCGARSRSFVRATQRRGGLSPITRAESRTIFVRSAAVDAAEAEADLMELELKVEGMVCDGCSTRVADALKAMNGVDKVDVNLSTGIATVELQASDPMDAAFNKMPKLVAKVGELGFKAQAHFEDW